MTLPTGLNQQETIAYLAGLGDLSVSTVNKVRPADTIAYAPLDAVDESTTDPTGWVFTNIGKANGADIIIVRAELLMSQSSNTSIYRLHLYTEAPTYPADNTVFTPTFESLVARAGVIDFPAAASYGAAASYVAITGQILAPIVLNPNSRNLYGILEIKSAYTPQSAQKMKLILTSQRVG